MTLYSHLKLLLIEDNFDHAELVGNSLHRLELSSDITLKSSGEDALSYLKAIVETQDKNASRLPDIILLDIRMPKMTGIEVLKHLKDDHQLSQIPVIMLSTSSLDFEIDECSRLGAVAQFVKPLEYGDFIKILDQLHLNQQSL